MLRLTGHELPLLQLHLEKPSHLTRRMPKMQETLRSQTQETAAKMLQEHVSPILCQPIVVEKLDNKKERLY